MQRTVRSSDSIYKLIDRSNTNSISSNRHRCARPPFVYTWIEAVNRRWVNISVGRVIPSAYDIYTALDLASGHAATRSRQVAKSVPLLRFGVPAVDVAQRMSKITADYVDDGLSAQQPALFRAALVQQEILEDTTQIIYTFGNTSDQLARFQLRLQEARLQEVATNGAQQAAKLCASFVFVVSNPSHNGFVNFRLVIYMQFISLDHLTNGKSIRSYINAVMIMTLTNIPRVAKPIEDNSSTWQLSKAWEPQLDAKTNQFFAKISLNICWYFYGTYDKIDKQA